MAEFGTLHDLVADLVPSGASVAMEGFTHLIPFAAGHEIIRQEKRDLTLIRMTPDLIYDQMIGMGCAARLVFSWGGNPGVGSLYRLRDALAHGWPVPVEIEEHSHAGMAVRYAAGAAGLPFGILRGYLGTDLVAHTTVAPIRSPFDGEELAAVPALNPDVAIIHAQQADRRGNVGLWGITGVQREAVLSARAALVTVEEVVDALALGAPNPVVLPAWTVTGIAHVSRGSHPSYAMGYTTRDNGFYTRWNDVSADRDRFVDWMGRHVLSGDFTTYLQAVDSGVMFDEAGDA